MKNLSFLFVLISSLVFSQQIKKVTSSEIRWKAYKTLKAESLSHFGTIKLKSGAISLDASGTLNAGTFIMDMSSIDAQDMNADPKMKSMLENHLESDDFFDAAKFPTATFKITAVKKLTDTKYKIIGNLTIKDISKSISFPATMIKSGNTVTMVSDQFTFNRKNFGLNYNVFEDMIISKDVEMNIKFTAQ
jgi:polyisoprenoid-binding protein YceI